MTDAIKKLCGLKTELETETAIQSIRGDYVYLTTDDATMILAAIRDLEGVASGKDKIVPVEETALAREFVLHWNDYADCSYFREGFPEDCEKQGWCELRDVEDDDLDDTFAYERGIEPGGMVFALTAKGRAMLFAVEKKEGQNGI